MHVQKLHGFLVFNPFRGDIIFFPRLEVFFFHCVSSYFEGEESPPQAPPNFKFYPPLEKLRKKNLVRVRVRKYGYVKEFAGLSTGTGYFEKHKFGKSTGTESF